MKSSISLAGQSFTVPKFFYRKDIMVNIMPFMGYRYNPKKVEFGSVISPPYDVISESSHEKLLTRSPYNVVRLILGNADEDWYSKAKKLFDEWQKNNIIMKDSNECIYIYSQKYSIRGGEFTRTGFISLIELEEFGKGVLPHEKTFKKHIEDRLRLTEATQATFGQIFMLYDDRDLIIDSVMVEEMQRPADITGEDDSGLIHGLWLLSDKNAISKIKDEMKKYRVVIADGHHRYTTALTFRESHPKMQDAKYLMATFINSFHSGLFILPTHRFIHSIDEPDMANLLKKLKLNFDINEVENEYEMMSIMENTPILVNKEQNIKNHLFGMYHNKSKRSFILKFNNPAALGRHFTGCSDIYKKLDVNILHKFIIEEAFGITEEEQAKGEKIDPIKATDNILNMLKENKKYQFGFIINPPLMREVFLTARANETMPRKSTYFYPKIYTGIVINKMEK